MKRYLLLLIGIPIAALPASFAAVEGRGIDRARRVYANPPSGEAVVTGRHSATSTARKGRGSTIYRVMMQSPAGPVSRRVRQSEYATATPGMRTAWHVDPATGEALSEIERGWRTDGASYGVLLGLSLLVAVILARGAWQGLPGGAAEGRVRRGGPPCPETRDLRLPRAPRDPGRWEEWLRRKYPRPGFILWPSLGLSLLVAAPAAALDGPEVAVALGLQQLLLAWTVFLATGRGRRRDRILWERGEERHAVVGEAKTTGNVRRYEVSYEFGGDTYTLRQWMPIEGEAQRMGQDRVVVLVDPSRASRATVVPRLGI